MYSRSAPDSENLSFQLSGKNRNFPGRTETDTHAGYSGRGKNGHRIIPQLNKKNKQKEKSAGVLTKPIFYLPEFLFRLFPK